MVTRKVCFSQRIWNCMGRGSGKWETPGEVHRFGGHRVGRSTDCKAGIMGGKTGSKSSTEPLQVLGEGAIEG